MRIGTAYPEFFPQLAAIMRDFKQTRPDIELNIVEARSSILNSLIEQGKLDFALMSKRDGAHGWHEIAKDALVALVPTSHPLAQAAAYPLSRFEADPFIEIGLGEASDNRLTFNRYGIAPNIIARVQSPQAAQEMVSVGLSVTLSNHLHATNLGNGIAVIPVNPTLEFSIGAAMSKHCSPAARIFSKFAIARLRIE